MEEVLKILKLEVGIILIKYLEYFEELSDDNRYIFWISSQAKSKEDKEKETKD